MNDSEKHYAKGFNNGYILAKHTPEIYSVIEKGVDPKTDYLEGFISGGREYEHEKNTPEKTPKKEAKPKNKDVGHDR